MLKPELWCAVCDGLAFGVLGVLGVRGVRGVRGVMGVLGVIWVGELSRFREKRLPVNKWQGQVSNTYTVGFQHKE